MNNNGPSCFLLRWCGKDTNLRLAYRLAAGDDVAITGIIKIRLALE
jgi:hypothetical protein